MMYLIEYMSIHDTIITIAVGDPKSLIDVICTLDKSTRIKWWKIVGYNPEHFGWSKSGWEKLKRDEETV